MCCNWKQLLLSRVLVGPSFSAKAVFSVRRTNPFVCPPTAAPCSAGFYTQHHDAKIVPPTPTNSLTPGFSPPSIF